jgi:hypothetical protein
MIASKALVIVGMISVVGATAATASDHRPRERGFVMPCSLDGVNPAYHPDIFGNPAAARSYGFVRSQSGRWQVAPDCHRW